MHRILSRVLTWWCMLNSGDPLKVMPCQRICDNTTSLLSAHKVIKHWIYFIDWIFIALERGQYLWLGLREQGMWAHKLWLFLKFSWLVTFEADKLWPWNFPQFNGVYYNKLQNTNILFQYWEMNCKVMRCSLCPHAMFSQAQSHFLLLFWWFIKADMVSATLNFKDLLVRKV